MILSNRDRLLLYSEQESASGNDPVGESAATSAGVATANKDSSDDVDYWLYLNRQHVHLSIMNSIVLLCPSVRPANHGGGI